MKTLKAGIIGYGFMGRMHTWAYKSIPMLYQPAPARVELAACAVRTPETQRLAREQGGFEWVTGDWREVVERQDIDIINCCTPNDSHHEIVMAAIRAGKHVYVDKPLASNLQQARDIVQAHNAASDGRTRQMAMNYRFVPALMRARQILQEHRLGRIYTFAFRYIHDSNADPSKPLHWKSDRRAGGGVLADLGSHIIDLTRWLLGDFRRVLAHPVTAVPERPDGKGGRVEVHGDDATLMLAELRNGATGTLEASKLATGSNDELTIDIRGEQGALRFNLMDPNWLHFYDSHRPSGPCGGDRGFTAIEAVQRYPEPAALPGPKLTVGWMRFHIHSMYQFVLNAAEGLPGDPSLADGLAVQEVLEAAYTTPGAWTEIPPSPPRA